MVYKKPKIITSKKILYNLWYFFSAYGSVTAQNNACRPFIVVLKWWLLQLFVACGSMMQVHNAGGPHSVCQRGWHFCKERGLDQNAIISGRSIISCWSLFCTTSNHFLCCTKSVSFRAPVQSSSKYHVSSYTFATSQSHSTTNQFFSTSQL